MNNYLQNLVNKRKLDNIDLRTYANFIKNSNLDFIVEDLKSVNTKIIEILSDEVYNPESSLFKEVPLINDVISNKLNGYMFTNNYPLRKELSNFSNKLNEFYELNKNCSVTKKAVTKYSKIMDCFLSDESKYLELKRFTEDCKEVLNSSYDNEHIIFHIQKLYCNSLLNMINRKQDINKDYILSIYLLFTRNPNFGINQSERKKLDANFDKLINQIKRVMIKRSKANELIREVNKLRSCNFYLSNNDLIDEDLKKVDSNRLTKEIEAINILYPDVAKLPGRKDLRNLDTICLNSKAYSVIKLEDGYRLLFHVVDIHDLIRPGSNLDIYLYNCLMQQIIVEEKKGKINFSLGKEFPTITYDIKVLKNGNIEDLKIYSSIINIDNKIGELENVPNEYLMLYKRILNQLGQDEVLDSVKKINNTFELALSKLFAKTMYDLHLPIIYLGAKNELDKNTTYLYNQLVDCALDLNKKELSKLIKIASDKSDKLHYSTKYMGNDAVYKLPLTEQYNYLNLLYLRMIDLFIFKNTKIPVNDLNGLKKSYRKSNELLSIQLNKLIGYVEQKEVISTKNKVKTNRYIDKRNNCSKISV